MPGLEGAALPFACFLLTLPLPGVILAVLASAWKRRLHAGTAAFLALLASLGITSLLGLLAALGGVLTLWHLAAANAVLAAALAASARDALRAAVRALPAKFRRPRPASVAALAVVAIGAALLYSRPSEWYFGGWDPGIYVNTGASIARTGGLTIRDGTLPELPAAERDLFGQVRHGLHLKYPGFVIRDAERGIVQPYFYHLYPVWIALVDAGLGVAAGLLVGPLFVLLALAGLYLLGRALFSARVGLGAVALFGLSIPVIWQARFPTSEPLALFFLVGGWLCVVLFLREGLGALSLLAALAFGCALLTKITTLLPIALTLGGSILLAAATGKRRYRRLPLVLAVPCLLVLPYYLGPSRESTVAVLGFLPSVPGGLLTLAAAGILLALPGAGIAWAVGRFLPRHAPAARWLATLLIAGLGLYGYFARPFLERSSDAANLVELGWFVTPLALLLAAAGMALLVHRRAGGDRAAAGLLFLGVAAGVTFVLISRKQIVPIYPWALRRFVPEVLPSLALFAAVALAAIAGGPRARRARGALAAVLLVATVGWGLARGRELLVHRDYAGAFSPLARVAAVIPDDALAVCVEGWLATPLHFIHGKRTLQVSDLTPEKAARVIEAIAARVGAGKEVWLITDDGAFYTSRVGLDLVKRVAFDLPLLEQTKGVSPQTVRPFRPVVHVFRCRPFAPGTGHRPERIEIGRAAFGLGPGFFKAERLLAGGERRSFRWTGAVASLDLPAPRSHRPWELVLKLGSGRPPGVPRPQVAVLLDGELAAIVGPSAAITEFVVPVPATAAAAPEKGFLTVTLRSDTFVPEAAVGSRDGRALGVMAESVEIR